MKDIPQWSPDMNNKHTITDSSVRAKILFHSSAVSCILVGVFTFVCINLIPSWYGLIAAFVLMALIIPFFILGKKHGSIYYKSGIITNSVACGFSIGAYYSYFKTVIKTDDILIATAAFLLLSLLAFLTILRVNNKKASMAVIVLSLLFIIAALTYFWAVDGSPLFSYSFFLSLWLSFYCITGYVTIKTERNIWKDIFGGSCGAFFIVTLIVLLIISQGEGLDGIDFGGGGTGNKKKL